MENENVKELENLNDKVNEWNNAKRSPIQLAEELEQVLKDMSTRYFGNNLHANEIYMYWNIVMDLDNGRFTKSEINELAEYVHYIWIKSDDLIIKNIIDTIFELSEEMTVNEIIKLSYSNFIDKVIF